MTRRVRTTIRPDQVLDVDDAEYTDLQRQGLILFDEQYRIAEELASQAPDPTEATSIRPAKTSKKTEA